MPRKLIILILILLAFSLSFSQGYNMQVVGSWRCPTGDLSDPWVGGIEVLGDYVVMARFHWRREGSDTLWIIDVSDKKNPTLAATYVETTLCPRPARIDNFVTVPDSNLIVVNYLCDDSIVVRVLQLDPSDSVLIVPRGYIKHGMSLERLHEFFGGFVFSDDVYYLHSPDSVVRVSSLFVETDYGRTYDYHLSSGGCRDCGFIIFISSDSIYFIGSYAWASSWWPDPYLDPSPYLAASRLHLHSPPGYDTLEWLGFWCGFDWEGSMVTAIGYSDSMNLLAALTNHYLVLLQPSTNPSDLGRRYFREIGRYRRWGRDYGYNKMIFDRNFLIFCDDDTLLENAYLVALRFYRPDSFGVVGYLRHWYVSISKRGRYIYGYRWTGNMHIIECLFDSSGVNDGGSYYRHDGEEIDIYPNPVYYGGNVNISSRHDITIYNIRGNVVAKISGGDKTVKLNLSPGIYFAVSSNEERKTVTKFVVIK